MTVSLERRGLTKRDQRILAIEKQWWAYPGAKATAIREQTGLSEVRFYVKLNALIDTPAAMAFDPMTVKRLQRLRERRRAVRRG